MIELSPERVGRITGSRIGALLGLSPYGDRSSLMREMVRQHFGAPTEFTGNYPTERGERLEGDAVAEYQLRHPHVLIRNTGAAQVFVAHPEYPIGGTPDGFVDFDGLIEVKCPMRITYTHISQRPDYYAQVMLNLEATDRQWCDFVVWHPDEGMFVSTVRYDPWWIRGALPVIQGFLDEYAAIISYPELYEPLLVTQPETRCDPEWDAAAEAYIDACAVVEAAEQVRDDMKARLIELAEAAPELPSKGAGVALWKSARKTVAYKDALKASAPGVDLTPYTTQSDPVWTVRRRVEPS